MCGCWFGGARKKCVRLHAVRVGWLTRGLSGRAEPAAQRRFVSGTDELPELVHEVWIDGEGLPGVCLAGPAGDGFRSLLDSAARLVHVFEASSHFGAMQTYHAYLGRELYTTDDPSAFEPDTQS